MNHLEKTILATVAYYDIFDYPLTGFELWRYLILPSACAPSELHRDESACVDRLQRDKSVCVDQLWRDEAGLPRRNGVEAGDMFLALQRSPELREHIRSKYGFYFLAGREEIVAKRLERKKLADQKWRRLRRVFRHLVLVPFVRGIFLSGSLAMENSKPDSDVDIIVVASYGRIWTVRTLLTLLTALLGVRRHADKTRNRICLNHYITDRSLCIPFPSLYNAQSYVHLLNVFAEDEPLFRRFQAENIWLGDYLVNYRPAEIRSTRSLRQGSCPLRVARLQEILLSGHMGDLVEKLFSRLEGARIRRDPLFHKAGGRITIDDHQLEFHPDSHERIVLPEFNRRMQELGLLEFIQQRDSGLNA